MLEGAIYFIVLSFVQVKGFICLSQVGSIRVYTSTCASTILFGKGILLHKGLLRGV
jgi:hypothetical protein